MGPSELFRRDPKVECARVGDLQVVVVHGHGHGTARNRIVTVADGVGDRLASGTGRVQRLVFTHHLPGDDPTRNGHMVHQEGFGPPQE